MLKRVGYVIVFVRDMEAAVEFWSRRVGASIIYNSSDWSEIKFDNIIIALHKDSTAIPRDTGIVFIADNIYDVVEALRSRDVNVSTPKDIGVGLESSFTDPEGNTFKIFQPKSY